MKRFLSAVLLVFFVLVQSASAGEGTLVRVQLKDYPREMREIQARSLDVAGVAFPKKQVDLIVKPEEISWLRARGFAIVASDSRGLKMTPDTRYQNPVKIESALKGYQARFPALARVRSIGKSIEGRDIWAIQISKDIGNDDPSKPHVFFNSMHHAREVMTSEIGLDIVDQLLNGYGKDEKITHWLESYVVDVIPMFNVDGNNLVWTHDSMWRKNSHGGYGVDINRNYPFAWASCNGSSSSRSAQDYHGESAASEPETRVMMDFVKSVSPVMSISYHSYSEIVIYPYGCEGQRTETKEVVEKIGKELAQRLKTDDNRGTYTAGTAPELLYSVDGGDIDWLYAVAGVIPFVIEVNSTSQGFQPSYSRWRDMTVERQREGWKYLLGRMDGSSIYGRVMSAAGAPVENAKLRIRGSGGAFNQNVQVRAKGFFNVILNPGIYDVTVEAPGQTPRTQKVAVDAGRKAVNFAL